MSWRPRLFLVLGAFAVLVIGGARLRGPASPSPGPVSTGNATLAWPGPTEALSVGVSDVHPSVTSDGSRVLSVRLVAHVRAAVPIDPTMIRFGLTPPGSIGTEGRVTDAPSPAAVPSGAVAFVLTFDLRGLSAAPAPGEVALAGGVPPAPGVWLLTVELHDASGGVERGSTPVQVVAGA